MKIEIKNVKHNAAMSEETYCFSATVYIDGKREFGVSNRGCGGCHEYFPLNNKGKIWDLIQNINNELKKETLKIDDFEIENDLDIVISELVTKWLREREAKRLVNTRIIYLKDGDLYSLPTKYKPTKQNLEKVKKASWWGENYVLMNNKPIKEIMNHI